MAPRNAWLPRLAVALIVGSVAGAQSHEFAAQAEPAASAGESIIRSIGEVTFVPRATGQTGPLVFSANEIRRRLQTEVGAGCEPHRIEERLATPYRFLGYVPHVRVFCQDGILRVAIRESSHRIALVTLDPSDLSRIGMAAGARSTDERLLYPVPASAPRDLLLGLVQTRPGDLYNVERYRSDREALGRLGYELLFIAGPPAADDAYPEGAFLIQSLSQQEENPATKRHKLNYFGGTATYAPRTGAAAGLIYQRSDLWHQLDRLTISPTFSTALGGQISYASPFLAARVAPRHLYDFNVSAFSIFQRNRLLDGEEVDQRQTGMSVTLGARPLRIRPPHDLRLDVTLRREEVELLGSSAPDDSQYLSLVILGATHVWRHVDRPPGLTLRTTPVIECSLPVAGGISFIRPGLASVLHSRLMSGFEVNVRLTGGGTDRPVPDFELWSLGGVTTVRGFQEDTFLGRGVVALQSELWIPLARPLEAHHIGPGEADDPSAAPREKSIARRLKAAVFVDGGAVWQSENSDGREALYGAGVGIRFVVPQQPLVIRLDYGWGLGDQGGDGYPYVSIGYIR